jgi:hypothetical protein
MPIISSTEVKAIITTKYDDVAPFIKVAEVFLADKFSGVSIGTALNKEIHRWTAAHFISISDPRLTEKEVGEATEKFNNKLTGNTEGLKATMYGRQAIALDPTGLLAKATNRAATFEAIGQC